MGSEHGVGTGRGTGTGPHAGLLSKFTRQEWECLKLLLDRGKGYRPARSRHIWQRRLVWERGGVAVLGEQPPPVEVILQRGVAGAELRNAIAEGLPQRRDKVRHEEDFVPSLRGGVGREEKAALFEACLPLQFHLGVAVALAVSRGDGCGVLE